MVKLIIGYLACVLNNHIYFTIENTCDYCIYSCKDCFLYNNISMKTSCGCQTSIY